MQARNLLWLLVLLLAIESLVGEFYRTVPLTVLHLTILLSFAFVHGAMHYGTRGIVAFAVICLAVPVVRPVAMALPAPLPRPA